MIYSHKWNYSELLIDGKVWSLYANETDFGSSWPEWSILSATLILERSGRKFGTYLDIPVCSWTTGPSLRPLPVDASLGHFALLKLNNFCIIQGNQRCNEINQIWSYGDKLGWEVSWVEVEVMGEGKLQTAEKLIRTGPSENPKLLL